HRWVSPVGKGHGGVLNLIDSIEVVPKESSYIIVKFGIIIP
ncbi:hypothetical protein LCGC14_2599360, partial [marine sediment metagenome]